jgi:hypothetical protein
VPQNDSWQADHGVKGLGNLLEKITPWWIGMVLLLMVIFCAVLVIVAIAHSLPPELEAERKLKRRYLEYRNRQNEVQRKAELDR